MDDILNLHLDVKSMKFLLRMLNFVKLRRGRGSEISDRGRFVSVCA